MFRNAALGADSAVILMYHRFGENDHPKTNISIEQFVDHLNELSKPSYEVIAIPEILRRLALGEKLPDHTVGITIDDAFRSVYSEAFPRLKKYNFPFTLFIATEPLDRGLPDYMSWDQVREMRDAGVTIGSQTHTHLHMTKYSDAKNRKDLERANTRFETELGNTPKLLAYPYGEAAISTMNLAKDLGFEFAFGQHSGVVHNKTIPYFLPRFALNETYGDVGRFRLIVNTLPLPVRDIVPFDPLIKKNPPAFGFTVDQPISNISQLSCYHSQQGAVKLERLGTRRVEIRFSRKFEAGRSRLNCTIPGPDNRWHWFGRQFYVKAD